MTKWFCALSAFACCVAVPSSAQVPANGQMTIHIETWVDTTNPSNNTWVSTGAFTDQGHIDVSNVNHGFKGASDHVDGPMVGQLGTLHIEFVKAFGQFKNGIYVTHGTWEIVGGTGAYEGMTGRGTLRGSLNTATNELHDEFDGTVILQD